MTEAKPKFPINEKVDQYYQKYSQQTINTIVTLRKKLTSFNQISQQTHITVTAIKEILRHELGEEYPKYHCYNTLSNDLAKDIIALNKKGKSIKEIANETKVYYKYIESLFYDPFIPVLNRMLRKLEIKLNHNQYSELKILYKSIWDQVRLSLKHAKKLLPVILYMFLKIQCIKVSTKKIIEASDLPERRFKTYLLYVIRFCPEYASRNRVKMVQRLIHSVIEYLHFDRKFTKIANSLLKKFWNNLTNTTESNIAGVICILTMIKLDINTINYNMISGHLGIQMSSIFYQVKHHILNEKLAKKFTGFKRSSNLLRPLLTQ